MVSGLQAGIFQLQNCNGLLYLRKKITRSFAIAIFMGMHFWIKIKSFSGTCKNSIMTQSWNDLCIYLLMDFIKVQPRQIKNMRQILHLLQFNLFKRNSDSFSTRGSTRARQSNIHQMGLL